MKPSIYVVNYLTNTQFIRNLSLDQLLSDNPTIPISQYICYSVGIVDGHRIVNIIQILKQTPPNGVLSFYIRWYMPKYNNPIDDQTDDFMEFDYVDFWVHSGVALRKKFFYAEDRMSFLRSTFMHNPSSDSLYRLSFIWPWVTLTQENPLGYPIFNKPGLSYIYKKKIKNKHDKNDRKAIDFKKHCKRLLKSHNHSSYVEKNFPSFYKEIIKII